MEEEKKECGIITQQRTNVRVSINGDAQSGKTTTTAFLTTPPYIFAKIREELSKEDKKTFSEIQEELRDIILNFTE